MIQSTDIHSQPELEQDAGLHQQEVDALEKNDFIRAIRDGEADVAAGRTIPAKKLFAELREEFGLSG